MKATKIIAIATTAWLSFSALAVFAQGPLPPAPAGGPIDGGAILLVIGAAALGYKKMKGKDAKQIKSRNDK